MGALSKIRVLDLSRLLAGSYCAQLLADLGAEVTKIEGPGGDDSRALGPPVIRGESAFSLAANAGKRSLGLDLTRPEGRKIFLELARSADVLIENFRPDVKSRLGIDDGHLRWLNPRVVFCSIRARTGPPQGGERTAQVLRRVGYSSTRIRELPRGGIVSRPEFTAQNLRRTSTCYGRD